MPPSPGDVTVVTVNWNGKSHLSTLLPPLLALEPGEVIVVDNGSTDGSQEFLRRRYPQVRLLENGVNRGFAQPCNLGAETARGSCVAFINNDMRPEPDWLAAALEKLDARTPCVASRILDWEGRRIDYNGSSLHYLGYGIQQDVGMKVEKAPRRDQVLFPCGGAMLMDRRVFLELGGFDPDYFALFEDVDLGWRLWLAGYRVVLAPESVVRHRGHATLETQSPEKTRYLIHRNALLTIFKNYDEENFRKILPLALVLAVKRAVHFSGVRKESFYLWSDDAIQAGGGRRNRAVPVAGLPEPPGGHGRRAPVAAAAAGETPPRAGPSPAQRPGDHGAVRRAATADRGGCGLHQGGTGVAAVARPGFAAGSGPQRGGAGFPAGRSPGENPESGERVQGPLLVGNPCRAASAGPARTDRAILPGRPPGRAEGRLPPGVRLPQPGGVKNFKERRISHAEERRLSGADLERRALRAV